MKIDRSNTDDDEKNPKDEDSIGHSLRVRSKENDHHRWNKKEENVGHLNKQKKLMVNSLLDLFDVYQVISSISLDINGCWFLANKTQSNMLNQQAGRKSNENN